MIHIKNNDKVKTFDDQLLTRIVDQLFNIGASVSATRNAMVFQHKIQDGEKVRRKYQGQNLTIWKE